MYLYIQTKNGIINIHVRIDTEIQQFFLPYIPIKNIFNFFVFRFFLPLLIFVVWPTSMLFSSTPHVLRNYTIQLRAGN